MASLQKTYSKEKLNGQIYTPDFIVKKILDDINYNNKNIIGKEILDPACGDGQFLVQIAKRIIKFSKNKNLEKNLEKINGWDIDKNAIEMAKNRLNKLIENFNINIEWNLKCKNSIFEKKENNLFLNKKNKFFDYIIGNPPYIRIQHLEKNQRIYIQKYYKFCKTGSTDIYIAFFEMSYNLLKNTGICAFITPNTYFSTETAKEIRRFFEREQNIISITNYGSIQLFENARTYSSITIFSRKRYDNFLFRKADTKNVFKKRKINFSEIKNKNFWQLSCEKISVKNGKRLGDICDIHVGLTTLADKVYICKALNENGKTISIKTNLKGIIEIEKDILKPIIKASKIKKADEKNNNYIIFPYEKQNGKNKIISEKKLKKIFPMTYEYFLSVKNVLNKRDNGKPNSIIWYAFGRTQSLNTSFGEKIVFSPMNKKPNFIHIKNKETTFYSGYCIKYKNSYEELLKKLNSERMENFIKISSRDFGGNWKAYNKKILQEFII